LSVELAENFIAVDAGTTTVAPVCGLRPVRSLRRVVLNEPKPGHATLSPFFVEATTSSKKADISKADAERTIAAFFELVVASTKKGDKVAWPGFGSFSTTRRKERTGRNPQTGATVVVPASTAMKFSASSTLKAELNPNRK